MIEFGSLILDQKNFYSLGIEGVVKIFHVLGEIAISMIESGWFLSGILVK